MRVLIAEDNLISRKILAAFLAPYGETVLAADGNEALSHYRDARTTNSPFNIILLDMVMPNFGGMEVLEAIRKEERESGVTSDKQIPIIILTGDGDTFQINQAKMLGISDYMMKPIEETKLIRELQRLRLIPDPQDQWE